MSVIVCALGSGDRRIVAEIGCREVGLDRGGAVCEQRRARVASVCHLVAVLLLGHATVTEKVPDAPVDAWVTVPLIVTLLAPLQV